MILVLLSQTSLFYAIRQLYLQENYQQNILEKSCLQI